METATSPWRGGRAGAKHSSALRMGDPLSKRDLQANSRSTLTRGQTSTIKYGRVGLDHPPTPRTGEALLRKDLQDIPLPDAIYLASSLKDKTRTSTSSSFQCSHSTNLVLAHNRLSIEREAASTIHSTQLPATPMGVTSKRRGSQAFVQRISSKRHCFQSIKQDMGEIPSPLPDNETTSLIRGTLTL